MVLGSTGFSPSGSSLWDFARPAPGGARDVAIGLGAHYGVQGLYNVLNTQYGPNPSSFNRDWARRDIRRYGQRIAGNFRRASKYGQVINRGLRLAKRALYRPKVYPRRATFPGRKYRNPERWNKMKRRNRRQSYGRYKRRRPKRRVRRKYY